MKWLVVLCVVLSSVAANANESFQKFLKEEFGDGGYELVCYSEPNDRGEAIVATYDADVRYSKNAKTPEEFETNIWSVENINKGEPKIKSGQPGSVQLLTKTRSETEGGGQKSFHTWVMQTNLPQNNPLNYRLWVFDQYETAEGKVVVAGRLINSPALGSDLTNHAVKCSVFKLK